MRTPKADCPRCGRTDVATKERGYGTAEYANHSTAPGSKTLCRMSKQLVPPAGTTEDDFDTWAVIVADLAEQVQDADPAVVWDYLSCLSPDNKQVVAMVAFAAVRCDGRIEDIFRWVCDLPVAQAVSA